MKTAKRAIAITELFMVLPAALFMAALFVRAVQPAAQTGRFVNWMAALPVPVGLYLLLAGLPFVAFLIGCVTLGRELKHDSEFRNAVAQLCVIARGHAESLLIAGVTVMSAVILALVAMHMVTE